MFSIPIRLTWFRLVCAGSCLWIALASPGTRAEEKNPAKETLWSSLVGYTQPPREYSGKFGPYRNVLEVTPRQEIAMPGHWPVRRKELLEMWHQRLGGWPEMIAQPMVETLEAVDRDGHTEIRVRVQIGNQDQTVEGYLLKPKGPGPFPAVLVPFYEPLTSIGRGQNGQGTHDYGLQLVKRGFVTLSIGTPNSSLESLGKNTREVLVQAGVKQRRQPLSLLAYVAATCHTALSQMPEVQPERIGIVGLSYGGKWSMFASCLHEKFACAVWSDPGIVFNEKNGNVNYWEPWYLGYDPNTQRKPGIPSETNPRTGLYKELVDQKEDLISLHALMAPRPVLV